ncbi:hypothetical protein P8C59_005770 [Phyllachora maydis]|uniref:N-acetyltransferase domain-containing protein n=1 Tax=Phyllachora maydis TaxID=1825666 RepID=A0AAD9MFU4_9PEZI|nr:hypothetical protein P8C59_005770 [Phyllachora maydis]
MKVRQDVFVTEQNVQLEFEQDDDDSRCCHWVAYAPAHDGPEPLNPLPHEDPGQVQSRPVGTIRLVPYPHPPHPQNGGAYLDGKLVGGDGLGSAVTEAHVRDRTTTFHDGREPYLKLGRLAVLRDSRGHGVATGLVREALRWVEQRPGFFGTNIASRGSWQSDVPPEDDWRGLVCVHAQKDAIPFWKRVGFVIDEEMGKWMEEGIPHVGMFRRLEVNEVKTSCCSDS